MSEFIIECEYDSDKGWIPGEHREEVVRCRVCKFSMFDKECSRPDPWVDETWFPIEPDGFCKWGERE